MPNSANDKTSAQKALSVTEWDKALYRIDLIMAAWQWPRHLVLQILSSTEAEMLAIRNNELEPSAEMIDFAAELEIIHYWIWTLPFWPKPVSQFWHRKIDFGSTIGTRTPLELVEEKGRHGFTPIVNLAKEWRAM